MADAEKYKVEDEEKRKSIHAKFKDFIEDKDKKKLQDIDWVDTNPNAEREEYDAKRRRSMWRSLAVVRAEWAKQEAPLMTGGLRKR